MTKNYSQLKALLAITKASLIATFREPSTVVFGLIFPFIFILVFGFLGGGSSNLSVAVKPDINKNNPIYEALSKMDSIKFTTYEDNEKLDSELKRGNISGLLDIEEKKNEKNIPSYTINLTTTKANPSQGALLKSVISGISDKMNLNMVAPKELPISVNTQEIEGRKFKSIDFILPGQLGFSLLSIGVFGTAFVFVGLRDTLVLKRFFATPIKKSHILIGEGLSRLVFAAIQASVIIVVGALFMGFTLVHGVVTFLSMLLLAIIGLTVFMGFGFIISGVAKSDNTVPPIANLVTLPQFLLSGTFFPTESFPKWLQPISNILPLTHLNEAMRKVAFEGQSLTDVWFQIAMLAIWGIVVYIIAIKTFRWE